MLRWVGTYMYVSNVLLYYTVQYMEFLWSALYDLLVFQVQKESSTLVYFYIQYVKTK